MRVVSRLQSPGPGGGATTSGKGATGTDGVTGVALPPDVYVAAKPLACTELSAVKSTCKLPDVAVTAGGRDEPLNDPSSCAPLLEPSYTLTKS